MLPISFLCKRLRHPATRGTPRARQLAATVLLLASPAWAAGGATVAWPPGWTVADGRAEPADGTQAYIDLSPLRPGDPGPALDAAEDAFLQPSRSAELDTGCGKPAAVTAGPPGATGAGCVVSRNGLPLAKASFVAWPVPGGTMVLTFAGATAPFTAYTGLFAAVVASVRPD